MMWSFVIGWNIFLSHFRATSTIVSTIHRLHLCHTVMSFTLVAPSWLNAQSFSQLDGALFVGFCFIIAAFFAVVKPYAETEKARAWIVVLLGSFVLSIVATIYVADAVRLEGLSWTTEHIHNEDFTTRCAVLFFVAVNIMDLVLGTLYYQKYLDPLSCYFHHSAYAVFAFCLLAHHYARGFLLCLFMEWPTFLLALGSLVPACRTDVLFGVTFFVTRIAYNIFFVYSLVRVAPEGLIWKICTAALCLHLFWFYKWSLGFFKKRSPKKNKD